MAHEYSFHGAKLGQNQEVKGGLHKDFSPQNPWQEVACDICDTQEIPAELLERLGKDLADPKWRKHCTKTREMFPAGLTYLSQLMGHDTSLATPRAHFLMFDATNSNASKMVNVIDKPLILATLYGQTLVGDSLLFDGVGRFHLGSVKLKRPGDVKKRRYTIPLFMAGARAHGQRFVPILADQRNSDQPILLQIVVEFQKLHNKFIQLAFDHEIGGVGNKEAAFTFARAATVRTWHNLIRNDLLGQMLTPENQIPAAIKTAVTQVNETHAFANLAHAAFRCFHSLVLEKYTFNVFGSGPMTHSIADVLKSTRNTPQVQTAKYQSFLYNFLDLRKLFSGKALAKKLFDWTTKEHAMRNDRAFEKWSRVWMVDWALFFGPQKHKHKNQTCFSPSFQFKVNRSFIAARDFKAGYINGTSDGTQMGFDPEDVNAMLSALDQTLGTQWVQDHTVKAHTPLMLKLLADGFRAGDQNGRLGPVGSMLVHQVVGAHIAAAELAVGHALSELNDPLAAQLAQSANLPHSFLEMITYDP